MDFVANKKLDLNVGSAVAVKSGAINNFRTNTSSFAELDYSDDNYEDALENFLNRLKDSVADFFNKMMASTGAKTDSAESDASKSVNTNTGKGVVVNGKFAVEKGTTTIGWASSKWIWDDLARAIWGTKADKNLICFCLATLFVAVTEGVNKVGIKELSGVFVEKNVQDALWAEFWKGVTKSAGTKLLKSDYMKNFAFEAIKNKIKLPKNLSASAAAKIFSKVKDFKPIDATRSWWDKIMARQIRQFKQNERASGAKKVTGIFSGSNTTIGAMLGKFGVALGVDYLTSIASNIIGGWVQNGELNITKDAKLGSTALKSTTKMIFATAGEIAFGKIGKIVGTAVGSYIGEFQVALFTDENGNYKEGWCAAAAGAEIVGAVVGVAILTFCVSNPAGWVVGLCLVVGAAVGFAVTWVASLVDWEAVGTAIVGAVDATKDAIVYAYEATKDAIVDAYEATKDAIVDAYEATKDAIVDTAEAVKDTVVDFVEDVCGAVNAVCGFFTRWAT